MEAAPADSRVCRWGSWWGVAAGEPCYRSSPWNSFPWSLSVSHSQRQTLPLRSSLLFFYSPSTAILVGQYRTGHFMPKAHFEHSRTADRYLQLLFAAQFTPSPAVRYQPAPVRQATPPIAPVYGTRARTA